MPAFSELQKAVFQDIVQFYGRGRGKAVRKNEGGTRIQRLFEKGFKVTQQRANGVMANVSAQIKHSWNSGEFTDTAAERLGVNEADLITFLTQRGFLTPEGQVILTSKEQKALDAARREIQP